MQLIEHFIWALYGDVIINYYRLIIRYLATAGSDGDVRIYRDHDDDDPVSIGIKHPVYSIDIKVPTLKYQDKL